MTQSANSQVHNFFAFAISENMGLALAITLISSAEFITASGILAAILFSRFHVQQFKSVTIVTVTSLNFIAKWHAAEVTALSYMRFTPFGRHLVFPLPC